MGFGEAGQQKLIHIIDFEDGQLKGIGSRSIPCFQMMEPIVGDWLTISTRVQQLVADGGDIWLEIVYTGDEWIANLDDRMEELVRGSNVSILRVINRSPSRSTLDGTPQCTSLDELTPIDVFERVMDANEIPAEQRQELMEDFREILYHVENPEVAE